MSTGTALFNLRRAIWRSIALMVILLALYVLVGRQLTPMVERTVPTLERYLSNALDKPVRIAGIVGEWRGFGPSFTIRDLTIGDSFALSSLTLEPAILMSLSKQEAIFSRFIVNGADVDVVHDEGRLNVPAFDAVGQDARLQDVFARLYDQLLAQDAIQLRNIGLNLLSGPHRIEVMLADALIIGTHEYHELRGEVILDPAGQAVSASLQIEAKDTRAAPQLEAFLRHDTVDTATLLPDLEAIVNAADFDLRQLSLAAQWWLHWEQGQVQSLKAEVQHGGARFFAPHDEQEQVLSELGATLYWTPADPAQGEYDQARVRDFSFRYNDEQWPLSNHDVTWHDHRLQVAADAISISHAGGMIQPWLPIDLFPRHDLRGTVHNSVITVPRSVDGWHWQDATATGDIRDGQFAAWEAIPGFQRVNGEFALSPREGLMTLDRGPVDVDLSAFLPQQVSLDIDSAAVAWRLADDYTLKIASGPVQANWADSGQVNGRFAFTMGMNPAQKTVAEPIFALSLAGNRLHTDALRSALPVALDPAILDWIDNNLSQLASDSWSLVLPNVMSDHLPTRFGLMTARVNNLSVRIDDDWPRLNGLGGQFWLDHNGLAAQVSRGEFSGVKLTAGKLELPFGPDPTALQIAGEAEGAGADGWRLVTETPLRALIDDDIAQWDVAGTVRGALDLTVPLSDDPVRLVLDLALSEGELYMPDHDVRVRDINGPLRVSTRTGLSSRGLEAQWLNESMTVGVNTDVSTDAWNFYFPVRGQVNLKALGEWLDDPWLANQPFTIPVTGEVAVKPGEVGILARSDLAGWPLDLPAPLGKASSTARPATLALTLTPQGYSVRGAYGRHLQVNFNADAEDGLREGTFSLTQASSGQMRSTSKFPAIVPDRVQVNVEVPEIDLAAWQTVWETLQSLYLPAVAEAPPSQSAALLSQTLPLDVLRVHTDRVTWQGQETALLQEFRFTLNRDDANWLADWQSQEVAGQLQMPFVADEPGQLNLDYLRLPAPPGAGYAAAPVDPEATAQRRTRPPYDYREEDDLLAGLSPSLMPALAVVLQELRIGDTDYGQWQFDVLPETDQLRVEQARGDWRGMRLLGDMIWRMPEGREPSTQLDISAETGNIEDVLMASGLTPVITSRSAAGRALVEWRGSPAAFDATGLVGNFDFDLRSGSLRELDDFDGIRVIGLLNVTRIFRRLALDFRDVFSAGISYDRITGDIQLVEGTAGVGDRFLVDGSGAKMFFGGQYDMFADELDAEGVVIARVSNTAGLLALGAGFSPPVALMVIFGERAFEREMERLFSVRTRITGSLAQPDVRTSRLFDSDIRGNDATIEERMRELFGPEANR